MSQRVIVLSNGEINDFEVIKDRLQGWHDARVVAADAGSRYASLLGLEVDIVVGDLDSLTPEERRELEQQNVRFETAAPEKDETDLELALMVAAGEGATSIAVLGGIGGRIDMTIANILLMTHPDMHNIHVEMWCETQTAWVIKPPGDEIKGQPGDTVSLIPLGEDAQGVTSQGLEYALENETLNFGPARGVSNVLTSTQAHIELEKGLLLAVHTPGRA